MGNEYVISCNGITSYGGFFGGNKNLNTIECLDDFIVVRELLLGVPRTEAILPGRPDKESYPSQNYGDYKQYRSVCLHGYLCIKGYC